MLEKPPPGKFFKKVAPMRQVPVLVLASILFVLPSVAIAGETLLAREEIWVNVDDDADAKAEEVVTRAIESAKKHPCVIAAEKEGRELNVKIKLFVPKITATSFLSIVEIVTEDCPPSI